MADTPKESWKDQQKVAPRVKEGIDRNSFLKSREATKISKKSFKQSKQEFKLARQKYTIEQRSYKNSLKDKDGKSSINHIIAKKHYLESKTNKEVAKRVYRKTKAKDASRVSVQVKFEAKQSIKQGVKNKVVGVLYEDDTFRDSVDSYRKLQQSRQNIRMGLKVSKNSKRLAVKGTKNTYGLGNKFLNLARGRGFQRTPEDFTTKKQLMKKFRNVRQQFKIAKQAKKAHSSLSLAKSVFNGQKTLLQAAKILFNNPVAWIVLLAVIVVVLLMGVASTSQKPAIVQEEKDLTESWIHVTKLDAENSDISNAFYSKIDDVMFYMNYRFDDYKLSDSLLAGGSYETYLTKLWRNLNGEPPDFSLKTMEELETDKDSDYYIPEDEYSGYQEVKTELGYSTLDGQLNFPFETESLIVSRRFGYERNGDEISLNKSIEVMVESQQEILLPLDGKVDWKHSTGIRVSNEEARITLTGVVATRVTEEEKVSEGTYIGNATGEILSIIYEKYDSNAKEWLVVNPGFYFPKVAYTQTTMLGSTDFDPGADVESRAKAVYDYLTSKGYTRAGIAAILGNFSVESGINPKRAEGDYLNPPVGASASSWDNPSWLAMGGTEIYGKFPNIVHRGLGLGQWTDTADGGRRHTLLLDFAKSKNKKWYDLQLQLDFIFEGDSPGSRIIAANTAGSKVAATVPELTVYFLNYWEGNPGDKVTERIQAAQNWYQYLATENTEINGSSKEIFDKYKDKMKPLPTDKEMKAGQGWAGNDYWLGNCTWYVYNRMAQFGKSIHTYMGNANQWVYNYTKTPGAKLVSNPKRGDVVILTNGLYGSSPIYGHVAFVEVVNSDGTIVVSEMNIQGEYTMGWRIFQKQTGMYFMRVN